MEGIAMQASQPVGPANEGEGLIDTPVET
jgi:hypothetical protein